LIIYVLGAVNFALKVLSFCRKPYHRCSSVVFFRIDKNCKF